MCAWYIGVIICFSFSHSKYQPGRHSAPKSRRNVRGAKLTEIFQHSSTFKVHHIYCHILYKKSWNLWTIALSSSHFSFLVGSWWESGLIESAGWHQITWSCLVVFSRSHHDARRASGCLHQRRCDRDRKTDGHLCCFFLSRSQRLWCKQAEVRLASWRLLEKLQGKITWLNYSRNVDNCMFTIAFNVMHCTFYFIP